MKNTNKILNSLAVVFTCDTEHKVVKFCFTFLQKSR